MSILSYCILHDLYGNSRINQTVREKRGLSFFLAERDQPSFQKCWECQGVWLKLMHQECLSSSIQALLLYLICMNLLLCQKCSINRVDSSSHLRLQVTEVPSAKDLFRLERRSANDVARRKAKDWGVNTWCLILFWNTCETVLIQTSVPGTLCFSLLWLFVKCWNAIPIFFFPGG